MRTIKTIKTVATVGMAAFLVSVSSAHAIDLIADATIRPFSPGLADKADELNHRLGNPIGHAAAAGTNMVLPGSGAVLEGAWTVQRFGVPDSRTRGRGRSTSPGARSNPRHGQSRLGNFCHTRIGRFGPGALKPGGVPCHAMTRHGTLLGAVGK